MTKAYLITIGIFGFFAILMGALGTHVMYKNLNPEHMHAYDIAVQFLMYHTLALLAIAFMNRYVHRSYVKSAYFLFVFGTAFFSGTIFLTSTVELTKMNFGILSKLTPIGGILLMIGWIVIMWSGVTYVHHKRRHRAE